jgi:hypothetical protein
MRKKVKQSSTGVEGRVLLRRLNKLNGLEAASLAVAFPGWTTDLEGSAEWVPATCTCHYGEQAEHLAELIEEGGIPATFLWRRCDGEVCTEPLPWGVSNQEYVASLVKLARSKFAEKERAR